MKWSSPEAEERAERFPLEPSTLCGERLAAYEAILERRGNFPLPYRVMLASPDVALQVDALSARLWTGHLPEAILEAVFLVVARRFQCAHQWERHKVKAIAAGVSSQCIEAIAAGLKPPGPPKLAIACDVAKRLLTGRRVTSQVWKQVAGELGEQEMADLCAFLGLASIVAMSINLQVIAGHGGTSPQTGTQESMDVPEEEAGDAS